MTEQQLRKLMGQLVEHSGGFHELTKGEAQWAIQNMSRVIELCVKAIKNRAAEDFLVWREITAYPAESEESVTVARLTDAGLFVSDWARHIMSTHDYKTLCEPRKFKLARLKVRELGLVVDPSLDQILKQIKEVGGKLCPPEIGPALRKKYTDQPIGDLFWLAMEPITDTEAGHTPLIFSVRRDSGGAWLSCDMASPHSSWELDCEFVFVFPE